MSKRREYLIQRLENLYEKNKDFYELHHDLKEHLLAKINMLKTFDEVGCDDECEI